MLKRSCFVMKFRLNPFFLFLKVGLILCFFLTGKASSAQVKLIVDSLNSPYYILSDTIIDKQDTLLVKAGGKVLIGEEVNLTIRGILWLKGSSEAKARLESTGSSGGRGSALRFEAPSGGVQWENAIVKNSRVVSLYNNNVIANVEFGNDRNLNPDDAIVRCIGGSVRISNCSFFGNRTGEGILIHQVSNPLVGNCFFKEVPDAIEFLSCLGGNISNCEFRNIPDDAIDLNGCVNTRIDSNLIIGVVDKGMEIGSENRGSSTGVICHRNILVDCTEGITFKEGSEGIIQNNTFYKNREAVVAIANGNPNEASTIKVENSVFFENKKITREESGSSITINYSTSDFEFIQGVGNIISHPRLVNPEQMNFSLSGNSPCIDAGNPFRFPDEDGSIGDMGAISFTGEKVVGDQDIEVWPIPVENYLYLSTSSNLQLVQLYSQTGILLLNRKIQKECELCSHFIDVGELESGIYILRLGGEDGVSRKIIKL